ncbi:MAG: dephospho-CoA kinase [Acidimicrobiales bacterium]|nr:dephospho-CoA kinase [Acidimicrobiales bacterium]
MSARHVLALTGGIGSGKSTASAHFGRLGAIVVDVDRIGREVAEVGGPAHAALVARFGPSIVRDGALDRAALASQVFGHPDALADLNAISHPAINRVLAAEVERAGPDDIVLFDQAVLVESAILGRWADGGTPGDGYQQVIVVETPVELRVQRLIAQRGMAEADARARIASQVSDAERRAVARWVIDNSGDETRLAAEVERVWAEVLGSLPPR